MAIAVLDTWDESVAGMCQRFFRFTKPESSGFQVFRNPQNPKLK